MSPAVAFIAPVGLGLLGAVVSLSAEAMGWRRGSLVASAVALGLAACVGLVAAITVPVGPVWRIFVTGAGYSMAGAVVMMLGALAGVVSLSGGDGGPSAFGGLVAFSAVALTVLASTLDIVVMLLALETAAVCGYALVALARTSRAHEAAMKYFVQGAIATALLVLGIAAAVLSGLLSSESGRFTAAATGADAGSATVAIALVFAAFAFKLGAFPFHAWAPDAYETAPPEASAFLASAVKVGVLAATYTLLTAVMMEAGLFGRVQWLVAGIAAASVIFGNLAALTQRSYTRLLAYSGIAQVGYGLTAIVTGNGNAALLFITAYGCAAAGAFAVARAHRALNPSWDGSIAGMAGLARRAPILSASLAVLLFSLTGIPPLFGFWGKFLVFLSAVAPTQPRWTWLAIVGLLGSVVSFGYYGYVLRTVYFEEEPTTEGASDPESRATSAQGTEATAHARAATWVVVGLALIVLAVGLSPLLLGFAHLVGIAPGPIGVFTLGGF